MQDSGNIIPFRRPLNEIEKFALSTPFDELTACDFKHLCVELSARTSYLASLYNVSLEDVLGKMSELGVNLREFMGLSDSEAAVNPRTGQVFTVEYMKDIESANEAIDLLISFRTKFLKFRNKVLSIIFLSGHNNRNRFDEILESLNEAIDCLIGELDGDVDGSVKEKSLNIVNTDDLFSFIGNYRHIRFRDAAVQILYVIDAVWEFGDDLYAVIFGEDESEMDIEDVEDEDDVRTVFPCCNTVVAGELSMSLFNALCLISDGRPLDEIILAFSSDVSYENLSDWLLNCEL